VIVLARYGRRGSRRIIACRSFQSRTCHLLSGFTLTGCVTLCFLRLASRVFRARLSSGPVRRRAYFPYHQPVWSRPEPVNPRGNPSTAARSRQRSKAALISPSSGQGSGHLTRAASPASAGLNDSAESRQTTDAPPSTRQVQPSRLPGLDNTVVVVVSGDLPFAATRFLHDRGIRTCEQRRSRPAFSKCIGTMSRGDR